MKYWIDWAELVGFFTLIVAFFIALSAGSKVVAYILVLLGGGIGGRIWWRVRENLKFPWGIILLGFLVGFVLGNRYGDDKVITLFYVIGIVVAYRLHAKGIIKSVEW